MMEAVLAAVMAAVTVTAEDIELKEPGVEKISQPFCGWLIFFYSGPQKHGSIRHAFLSTVGVAGLAGPNAQASALYRLIGQQRESRSCRSSATV